MADPTVFLTHHKCASTWLMRYLGEFSTINKLVATGSHLSEKRMDLSSSIFTWQNASYEFIGRHIDRGFHFIRNPLDIVVSAYHSHKNTHPTAGWTKLDHQRQILARCSVPEGLYLTLAFLERDDFYDGAVGPLHALRHWRYADPRFPVIKMEDAVMDPELHLGTVLRNEFPDSVLPPIDNHTFVGISGRQVGRIDETSHYRSGKADQWREILPQPLINYMSHHYSEVLDRFYPHVRGT